MRNVWILCLVFSVFLSPLVAAESDSFPYKAFNDKAISELKLGDQFFTEASMKDPATVSAFGIISGTTEETVGKLDLVSHTEGIRGILNCLSSAGTTDAAKTVWDDFLSVSEGSKLKCAGSDGLTQFRAACVVMASKFKPDDFGKIPTNHRVCYNPTISALLDVYRSRASIDDSVLEERIQNTRYSAAYARMKAGSYLYLSEGLGRAYLDLAEMKYRYLSLSEYKRYGDEQLLSDNDRLGLKVLAECVREKAPIGLIISYTERGEFPDESYLRTLSCIRINGASSLEDLQKNWAAMGKAVAGHNIFMKPAYSVVPSRAYDMIVGGTTGVTESFAQDAAASILEIDDFVNGDVGGMRIELKDRFSFKSVSSLSMAQRIVLADVLEKKFHTIYAERIQSVSKWKERAAGFESCVLGEVMGAGFGKVAGVVLRGTSKAPGGWKAVGLVAVVGVTAWGTKETIGSATRLISSYKEIPLNEKISETCGLVSEAFEIGPDLVDALKNLRKKGAALKPDENVHVPPRIKPDGAEPAKTRVQDNTPAQKTATHQTKDVGTPTGNKKAGEDWAASNPDVTAPAQGKIPVSPTGRKQAQKTLETAGVDLPKTVVLQNDLELTALRRKAQSTDPVVAAKAAADLKVKEKQVVKQLFDASFSDPNFRIEFRDGRLTYYPKKPSSKIVPKDVQAAFKRFQAGMKDAEIDSASHLEPHPDGVFTATASDYSDYLGRELKKNWECKNAAAKLASRSELFLGHGQTPDGRVIYFEPTIVCPREDQLFALFRNILHSDPTGPNAIGRTARMRTETIETFRATLDDRRRDLFDQVYAIMDRPKTLKDHVAGFFKKGDAKLDEVLKLRDEIELKAQSDASRKIKEGDDLVTYFSTPRAREDSEYILGVALALDPNLPAGIDPFGTHAELFKSIASTDSALAKNNFQAAVNSKHFGGAGSVGQLGKASFDAGIRIQLRYEKNMAVALLAMNQPRVPNAPTVSSKDFEYILARYGSRTSTSDRAYFKKMNEELSTLAESGLRSRSKQATGVSSVSAPHVDELGNGNHQTMVSGQYPPKPGQKPTEVGYKIGESFKEQDDLIQTAYYKKGTETGLFPETYGVIRYAVPLEHSFYQRGLDAGYKSPWSYKEKPEFRSIYALERIKGKTTDSLYKSIEADLAAGKISVEVAQRKKVQLAEQIAESDAELGLISARDSPDGTREVVAQTDKPLDNMMVNDETGKVVFVDFDVKGTSWQKLEHGIVLDYFHRYNEFGGDTIILEAYLRKQMQKYNSKSQADGEKFSSALKSLSNSGISQSLIEEIMGRIRAQQGIFLSRPNVQAALEDPSAWSGLDEMLRRLVPNDG